MYFKGKNSSFCKLPKWNVEHKIGVYTYIICIKPPPAVNKPNLSLSVLTAVKAVENEPTFLIHVADN